MLHKTDMCRGDGSSEETVKVLKLELVVVGLYNPPPASLAVLHKLTPILAQYPTAAVLLAGDFNIPPNPSMDKLGNP